MADDKKPKKKRRPEHRDTLLGTRVDPELAEKVQRKARSQGRTVAGVLRAFLTIWADDEEPYGFPPELPKEKVRAQKIPREKKPTKKKKK